MNVHMHKLALTAALSVMGASSHQGAPGPASRKSPDFTIVQPSGRELLLSNYRGKVVVVEFLFLNSPHCLRVAQTLNKLQNELGPLGFQSLAIAFGPDANGLTVTRLVEYLNLSFPVGYSSAEEVDKYLERHGHEILNIPQVVVIDRSGNIRARSGGKGGDPKLENEGSLGALLKGLLKEGPLADKPPKNVPASHSGRR
jgi:peroxiredoxin